MRTGYYNASFVLPTTSGLIADPARRKRYRCVGRFKGIQAGVLTPGRCGCDGLGAVGQQPGEIDPASGMVIQDMSASTFATPTPNPGTTFFIPGSSIWDVFYDAATGDVSQAQTNNLISQTKAQLVQSGMAPDAAQALATQRINSALDTYSGPGAFGINWTGSGPSAQSWLTSPLGASALGSIPLWVWLAGGGLVAFLIFKR